MYQIKAQFKKGLRETTNITTRNYQHRFQNGKPAKWLVMRFFTAFTFDLLSNVGGSRDRQHLHFALLSNEVICDGNVTSPM